MYIYRERKRETLMFPSVAFAIAILVDLATTCTPLDINKNYQSGSTRQKLPNHEMEMRTDLYVFWTPRVMDISN